MYGVMSFASDSLALVVEGVENTFERAEYGVVEGVDYIVVDRLEPQRRQRPVKAYHQNRNST